MSFSLHEFWVWDFWLADDGHLHHLYFLHAPRSLSSHDRHRHATIAHATSPDLTTWEYRGPVLLPGEPGQFDETAVWTGSVVQHPDGMWWMFYTGAQFPSSESSINIESIGAATSLDLHSWTKIPGPLVSADPRWYEVLADGTWREEACRDPWIHHNDHDSHGTWTMLYTARSPADDADDRGVIGQATSPDLKAWTPGPPLSSAGAGFHHLEVPQVFTIDDHPVLLFSCPTHDLATWRRERGDIGGIWAAPPHPDGGWDTLNAYLLVEQHHYSGRAVQRHDGSWTLLSFTFAEGSDVPDLTHHDEPIGIADPLPLFWSHDHGRLSVGRA